MKGALFANDLEDFRHSLFGPMAFTVRSCTTELGMITSPQPHPKHSCAANLVFDQVGASCRWCGVWEPYPARAIPETRAILCTSGDELTNDDELPRLPSELPFESAPCSSSWSHFLAPLELCNLAASSWASYRSAHILGLSILHGKGLDDFPSLSVCSEATKVIKGIVQCENPHLLVSPSSHGVSVDANPPSPLGGVPHDCHQQ